MKGEGEARKMNGKLCFNILNKRSRGRREKFLSRYTIFLYKFVLGGKKKNNFIIIFNSFFYFCLY